MLITLVGLPGSGKSTVGRHLARRLKYSFSDSDAVIEDQLGCAIKEYFEREGESRFRDHEESVIDALTQTPLGILATGGGAVLREVTRRRLRERSYVVYLHSLPDELLKRVRHDANRPLLQVPDPLGRLRELHAARDPFYRETAHLVIETGRPSVSTLVNTILVQLAPYGLERAGSNN